jgi:hypothetical protein
MVVQTKEALRDACAAERLGQLCWQLCGELESGRARSMFWMAEGSSGSDSTRGLLRVATGIMQAVAAATSVDGTGQMEAVEGEM